MLLHTNTNITEGTILGPDGAVLSKPTQILTDDEARLLRAYKKFLHAHGLREMLHCNRCFEGNLSDGMRAFVRDDQILFECRHKMWFYGAQTY